MMTRDSKLWWAVIVGAILTALTGHFDLLHRAFPGLPVSVDAQIELFAMLIGIVAGVMRMSPLPITPEGRMDAIQADKGKAAAAATVAHEAVTEAKQTAKAADAVAEEKDEA